MKSIRLSKLQGAPYLPHRIKVYAVSQDGRPLGYIAQDVTLTCWQVQDRYGVPLSRHHSIKKAVLAAEKVLA